VAKGLGIHLGPDEAVLYRKYLLEHLGVLDTFVQSRMEEPAPLMCSAARQPACQPSAAEDPLNAWRWKCQIEGAPEGLLAGKTVSYKDHIAVAGVPMSFGSFALEGFIPDFDATVVTRVLQAGGTIIGKNVMNGLSGGFGTGGGIGDYGRPLNPHNHEHVTGGSSSGSGAAVAAGEVDISFGGDQGGSIRIPAAFCGTVGHKPTFGLVSHFGIGFGSDQSIDYTGPMTRTVEDAAAALQATAGYDGYDPRQTRDVPSSLDVLDRLADGVSGLRSGVLEDRGRVYAKAQNVRPTFIGAYDAALADVDVLVMPTCLMTAPKNYRPDTYLEAVEDSLSNSGRRLTHNTVPFNFTGHPALAVPVGKSSAGLPASMQLVGRFFDDPLLMRAAYAYEHSTDWDTLISVQR
jgi:Asp-tRNA(Asn)/Glu-tRNA(Gln) amidotransferase A subunit family amidase